MLIQVCKIIILERYEKIYRTCNMLWRVFVDTFTDTRTCLLKTIPLSMGSCKTIKDDRLSNSPLTVESFLQLVGTSPVAYMVQSLQHQEDFNAVNSNGIYTVWNKEHWVQNLSLKSYSCNHYTCQGCHALILY